MAFGGEATVPLAPVIRRSHIILDGVLIGLIGMEMF